ncbi:hypothetical protein DHEL01_v205589 [Diaporthe helianthi]|uniref:Amidohydrolase-related domain-containing protein n=1 Tax=Diaporthe helianthi TaxID=158607 RepID=A0A2P5I0H6_DIAHE|nr:hypothetical protein DHEL01_v205589 [Diaporthe helianthi]
MSNSPRGYLDIHGHFGVPLSEEELRKQLESFWKVDFMVDEPWAWTAEGILPCLDKANVNDAAACLEEIRRGDTFEIPNDGYAVNTLYNGVMLSSESLEPVLQELDVRAAVCHVHPDAFKKGSDGRPSPLIDVAFDTARTITDMLYKGVFRRHRNIKWVFAHCGGALPVLAGRLSLLGTEPWVPNPLGLKRAEIEDSLSRLRVDTAATAKTGLFPAIEMVGVGNIIYGADCGVPCSTEATMAENQRDVEDIEARLFNETGIVGRNGWDLFPAAAKRADAGGKTS